MNMRNRKNGLVPLSTSRTNASDNRGFTLIELLLVMSIIAILAALSISGFNLAKDKARSSRAMTEIRLLEKEIAAYAAENAKNPSILADIGRAAAGTNICTLLDPWGNPYIYSVTLVRSSGLGFINTDYDLYSWGADLASSGASVIGGNDDDDIIRASDGAFVGPAIRLYLP